MMGTMRNSVSDLAVPAVLSVLLLTGCVREERPDAEVFTVRMLTSDSLSGRWERAAERGLGLVASELDAEVGRIRVDDPDGARNRLAEQGRSGVDLVFCVGVCSERLLYTEAAAWPRTVFMMLPGTVSARNVGGIRFLPEEVGYLAGAVAGAMATENRVGLIRGEGQPWIEVLEDGFVAGFRARWRKAVVEAADGSKGIQQLSSLGIGIALYASDRAEPAVLAAARDAGLLLVGTDPEMMVANPDLVVAAIDVDVAEAMLRVAREVHDGTFVGRVYSFDLGSGVLDVRINQGLEPEVLGSAAKALELARSEVTAGLVEFDELGL
jgi:basic membrane lipoprotein Med (substrate-binding protein (PBP1-ABC) superfamily)